MNLPSKKITVLLVDDSPLALAVIKKILTESEEISVIGTASNGEEALKLIPSLNPDVVCTDFHMPKMDGLGLTKAITKRFPRPILIISISVYRDEDSHTIFDLLKAGAMDVFPKPRGGFDQRDEGQARVLVNKIKILSGVVPFHKISSESKTSNEQSPLKKPVLLPYPYQYKILVMGASTGGPAAYGVILQSLPKDFKIPIICVQHISEGFIEGLVNWLDQHSLLKVTIAKEGERPKKGYVYFPPENHHLTIDSKGNLSCDQGPVIEGHRPSINITFRSVADYYGPGVICVLLTGMGSDGVEGMLDVKKVSQQTIAQDEKSSLIFGMPRQAIEKKAANHVWNLKEFSTKLLELTGS